MATLEQLPAVTINPRAVCPYLPPEIWQRIFYHHTQPPSLWHIGRQVCSLWRTEIPKVFVRKYLESSNMVQIWIDCGMPMIQGAPRLMGLSMIFNRYEGQDKRRCVFTEDPRTTGADNFATMGVNAGHSRAFYQQYERLKFNTWKDKIDKYLGADPDAKDEGGQSDLPRFDLPPHQIRIKFQANDTELPNLKYDFARREISFEWEAMFDSFYAEQALLKKRKQHIKPGPSNYTERKNIAKRIRRDRIKRWYLNRHDFLFRDINFDVKAEKAALIAIGLYELHGDFRRCAETNDERVMAELILLDEPDRRMFEDEDEYGRVEEVEDDEDNNDEVGPPEDLHEVRHDTTPSNGDPDEWGGLSDWEEGEQTWEEV
jgi:hypothetical protein